MTLAQVVYNITTDMDFAEQWRSDPDSALAQKGLKLSKEEKAFLTLGMKRYDPEETDKIDLSMIGWASPWVR